MYLCENPESRPLLGRRVVVIVLAVGFGLGLFVSAAFWATDRPYMCDGKPMGYWEKQVLHLMSRGGNGTQVDEIVKKMETSVTPFWLARLQTKDSLLKRTYILVWTGLPNRLKAALPEPIPQRTQRSVAHQVLSKLSFTNGIPELIALSYSNDAEVQEYAVHLLWFRAYQFYRPSEECVAAFCHALRSNGVRTRQWAVLGLGILPLHEEALPALEAALTDPDETVRARAKEIIRQIREQRPARLKHS